MRLVRNNVFEKSDLHKKRVLCDSLRRPMMVECLLRHSVAVVPSDETSVEKYADLLQIVEDLAQESGIDLVSIMRAKAQRLQNMGSYAGGVAFADVGKNPLSVSEIETS